MTEGLVGGASIDANKVPLTDEVLNPWPLKADAVLLGAVGGPEVGGHGLFHTPGEGATGSS